MYYILENGKPKATHDPLLWARWFEKFENRQLLVSVFDGGRNGEIRISTIFLGLDHSFGRHDDPVLWETMIFGGKHDQFQERYSSEEDARAGHEKARELVQKSLRVRSLRSMFGFCRKAHDSIQ